MTKEEIVTALLDDMEMPYLQDWQARDIVDFVLKKYTEGLPTLKGWVARDFGPTNATDLNIGKLKIWPQMPYRNNVGLFWMPNFPQEQAIMELPRELYPDLKWEDEPIEVELTIKSL